MIEGGRIDVEVRISGERGQNEGQVIETVHRHRECVITRGTICHAVVHWHTSKKVHRKRGGGDELIVNDSGERRVAGDSQIKCLVINHKRQTIESKLDPAYLIQL